MLTSETIAQRLLAWAAAQAKLLKSSPARPTILFVQDLYALLHELKGSVLLSQDPSITDELRESVLSCEHLLKRLATDEAELASSDSRQLVFLVTDELTHLESQEQNLTRLRKWLEIAVGHAVTITPEQGTRVLDADYSWDALSRARATNLGRKEYHFFERTDETTLTELPTLDQIVVSDALAIGGALVARKLEVLGASGTDIRIRVLSLVAFPTAQAPRETSRWRKLSCV